MMNELDARPHRIGQHHFRARFRLRRPDRAVIDLRGITAVRRHAKDYQVSSGLDGSEVAPRAVTVA